MVNQSSGSVSLGLAYVSSYVDHIPSIQRMLIADWGKTLARCCTTAVVLLLPAYSV